MEDQGEFDCQHQSQTVMTTIEKMIMFLKAIYRRDEVFIKIPITFFKEVGQIPEIERKAREMLKSEA